MEYFFQKEFYPLVDKAHKESLDLLLVKMQREKQLLDIYEVEGSSPELEMELDSVRRNIIDYANVCELTKIDKYSDFFTKRYKKSIPVLRKKWDYYRSSVKLDKFYGKKQKEKVDAADAEREQYFKKAKEEGSTWD